MSATTIAVATTSETVGPSPTSLSHRARPPFDAIISAPIPVPRFEICIGAGLAPSVQARLSKTEADREIRVFKYSFCLFPVISCPRLCRNGEIVPQSGHDFVVILRPPDVGSLSGP